MEDESSCSKGLSVHFGSFANGNERCLTPLAWCVRHKRKRNVSGEKVCREKANTCTRSTERSKAQGQITSNNVDITVKNCTLNRFTWPEETKESISLIACNVDFDWLLYDSVAFDFCPHTLFTSEKAMKASFRCDKHGRKNWRENSSVLEKAPRRSVQMESAKEIYTSTRFASLRSDVDVMRFLLFIFDSTELASANESLAWNGNYVENATRSTDERASHSTHAVWLHCNRRISSINKPEAHTIILNLIEMEFDDLNRNFPLVSALFSFRGTAGPERWRWRRARRCGR